jgi:RNA polymerase sigma-70 factor, ECF subfamily
VLIFYWNVGGKAVLINILEEIGSRPSMQVSQPITHALQDLARGDQSALDRLMPLVYAELRRLAGHYLRQERDGHTLQPTALVHEAYFRLVGENQPEYQNRSHFLGVAAHAMRQILIDHARTRNAAKRGGGQAVFSIDECMDAPLERPSALIQVDDALKALEQHDFRKAQLVEMRFFGGMTAEESAEVLNLPVQKVRAELRIAQAWLKRELDNRATPA